MYECPCCLKTCDDTKLNYLNKQLVEYFEYAPSLANFLFDFDHNKALRFFTNFIDNRWACDDCVDNESAILGSISEQTFCMWQPHLMYMDQSKTCRSCCVSFTFTKEEQKYWYQSLKFWVVSDAVNCKSCRKALRERKERISEAQREIEKLKANLDMNDPEQLSLLISLYQATESHKMVAKYKESLRRAVT